MGNHEYDFKSLLKMSSAVAKPQVHPEARDGFGPGLRGFLRSTPLLCSRDAGIAARVKEIEDRRAPRPGYFLPAG